MLSIISKLPTPTLKCFLDKLSVVYSVNNILIDERLCTWIDQNRRKKNESRFSRIHSQIWDDDSCIWNTKNADWDMFSFRSISLHFLSYKSCSSIWFVQRRNRMQATTDFSWHEVKNIKNKYFRILWCNSKRLHIRVDFEAHWWSGLIFTATLMANCAFHYTVILRCSHMW